MLFSEVYGSYYRTVAAVLAEAVEGKLTERRMTELVRKMAFAESTLSIPGALKSGAWPLLDRDLRTPLRHRPTMPLTTLEKRWLKALLQDPRIALFHPDFTGLEDVEPLYRPGTFVYFDRYTDGDPYEDSAYIAQFQTILAAIHGRRQISVRFLGHTGRVHTLTCTPYRLEYSAKDDKFRLLAAGKRGSCIINLARICACTLREEDGVEPEYPERRTKELTLLLQDERNALERVLLHFSHFEKETQRREDGLYRMKLRYDEDDETELLIRVLSFGPMLRVCAPEEFKALLRERISRQMELQRTSGNVPAPSEQNSNGKRA